MLAVVLCAMPLSSSFATIVNYPHRVAYYTTWSNSGGTFDSATEEIGQWANGSGVNQAVAWRTFKTAGDNTGSARHLVVGDEFTITLGASSAYGGFGVSLNSAGWSTGSWANRYNNSRVYLEADGYTGQWYVNYSAGSVGFGASVNYSTWKDYQLKVKMTSENTVTVREISDATWYTKYDCTLNGAAGTNISGYSVFLSDGWNSSANANIYWKPTTKVENTGTVEFGGDDADRLISGKISDGLAANNTTTASANKLYKIGYGMITLSSGNTYSGGSEIQFGTLQISADDCLGTPPVSATDNIWIWSTGSLRSSADFAINANRSIALGNVNDPSIGVLIGTTLTYGGIMNGAADWNKKEAGTLVLSTTAGANTGKVTIQGGTLQISNDGALGAVPGTAAEKINIWSSGMFEPRDTFTLNANRSIALGDVNGPKISVTSDKTMTYGGAISGLANWSKEGAGTLTLSGANTYGGVTTIGAGTLQLGAANVIPNASSVSTTSGAVFDLNGNNETINALILNGTGISSAGALVNSSGTAATLILGATSSLASDSSAGGSGDITIGGTVAIHNSTGRTLTKVGNNTLTLSNGAGLDNFSLLLAVSAGTVVLNKTGTASSGAHCIGGLTIASDGTVKLSGSGGYQIWEGTTPTISSGGVLDMNGQNQTFTSAGPTISGTGISSGGA
ncbi:MAG: autotransporter-associated beta strand repeat-containing protein, partial [bacterium]|nr:autotransporter-associated beta strand repeat-containing protein [bacterium]